MDYGSIQPMACKVFITIIILKSQHHLRFSLLTVDTSKLSTLVGLTCFVFILELMQSYPIKIVIKVILVNA